MANILIVEDEKAIQNIITEYLKTNNHFVYSAYDGIDALSCIKEKNIDLVILDIMIPNLDGLSVCKIIRKISNVPIVFLTAKSSEFDKLKGYEYGADDYITKPFSPRVLMAKINALLQRSGPPFQYDNIKFNTLEIFPTARQVFSDSKEIQLTHKEFEILLLFMRNPNKVFSREVLLEKIWGYDFIGTSRTVDTHIKNLRQKLGINGNLIVTLIRSGYKLEI